ncbi:hypothetical protein CHARACLAT_008492 [Characodon lateralis]|uniref:MHC class I antigen n=1 Tax=Characodon lateralis TaxID=208331 RepID=A0ABU7CQL3_9TELE|nr:hypothetical protein [Characodon lateralis]
MHMLASNGSIMGLNSDWVKVKAHYRGSHFTSCGSENQPGPEDQWLLEEDSVEQEMISAVRRQVTQVVYL